MSRADRDNSSGFVYPKRRTNDAFTRLNSPSKPMIDSGSTDSSKNSSSSTSAAWPCFESRASHGRIRERLSVTRTFCSVGVAGERRSADGIRRERRRPRGGPAPGGGGGGGGGLGRGPGAGGGPRG